MKKLLLLSALLLTLGSIAQSSVYVTPQELQYKYDTKLTVLKTTGKPFTGVEYTLNYYGKGDTTMLRYISGGKIDCIKSFYAKNKPATCYTYYNHGLKNDSICYERVNYAQNDKSDTTQYEIQYVTKSGQKLYRIYTYYQNYYSSNNGKRPSLHTVRTYRYFSKKDTKDFTDNSFRQDQYFDSAGFHQSYAETGMYYEYYENGQVKTVGRCHSYEYRVAHKGASPYYGYGRVGFWKYYNQDGSLQREEEYDENGMVMGNTTFFANGKPQVKYNYRKPVSQIKLPPTDGITLKWGDTVVVTQTYWFQNGQINSETFTTKSGDVITHIYFQDGKPQSVGAYNNQRKPFGIHKSWDEKGNVVLFRNYSVDYNDTVCYKRTNGKILAVNLRDRNKPIAWALMPVDYYNTAGNKYMYEQSTIYREYYRNGRIKCEANLKLGLKDGIYSEWDSTGSQVLSATYKNDIPDGQWSEWYSSGKPKRMLNYKNGLRDGSCLEYYPTGALKWENIYVNGIPGKPKAYAENGTQLAADNYLEAFFPKSCLDAQLKATRNLTLHHFLTDTLMSRSQVTVSDTGLNAYGLKMVAANAVLHSAFDLCSPAATPANDNNEFDLYHSCIAVSKTLYTEKNIATINAFFARWGIKTDRTKKSDSPVLGLEDEFLIYYSSNNILNKQVVVDSLELYLAPNANDPKKGYLLSMDLNFPNGQLRGDLGPAKIRSEKGYSIITIEAKGYNQQYQPVTTVTHYVVYDDLTSEYQYTSYGAQQWNYWALK